ncbi:ABC transporter permease [Thermosipho melanesiensis]|uniref:Binding-protein-dependent transport systems inner membrane component n=2 Tax=Thermosipho melanesiensis TaxID=46541 RepID=A6LKH8_THEM4|nr:ABC transporter permease [Thermosipho melanesiensis]ABR30429.1 binding-protein-dependent transport systems inner membrane component [Thermosipho melanesiensis BI429]APT73589.1 ABC transporter permease [Thermosipho melanesiensis]OOC37537.1 ABC transporter permease [Thermosipho melanesiensis]OOC39433.1 ABC transporter permease [Thermosipho melanesiensis]OOC39496.1 ABC transporter permease [Thermosipho melanesiensis]
MANESITKIKLKLFIKNFRKNWNLFKESKMGVFGLTIIIIFGIFALTYPIAWQFVDHSIYHPVTGTDPRVQDISYISKHMSAQNIIKGIEIPSSKLFTYSFLDQGEAFKKEIEKRIDIAQRQFVNLDYAQAFRHILDTIVDSYFPIKERMRFQTQLSQLLEEDLIIVKPLSDVVEIGDRKKFSLTSFKKLLESVDVETLAKALSVYKNKREVSTIGLWIKIAKGRDEREKFNELLGLNYNEEEIKQAEEEIFKAVQKLYKEGEINVQVSVSNQKDLEDVIRFDKISTFDLTKATVFNTLVDLITYAKIKENEEIISKLENSHYKDLMPFAETKVPDLENSENKKSNLNRIEQYFSELKKTFTQLGLTFDIKNPQIILDYLSGINLATISFDLSSDIKAKLENKLKDFEDIQESFRKKQEDLFKLVANSRVFMMSIISDIYNKSIEQIKVPEVYLSMDYTKFIPALDKPMVALLSYATKGTKHFDLIVENIKSAGDINYKREDIVEKLEGNLALTEQINFINKFHEYDILSKQTMKSLIKKYIENLEDKSYWEEKYSNVLMAQNDISTVVDNLKKTINLSQKDAQKLLVSIYNQLALESKLGIQHPLPPNRWHVLGTDPGGRDIFMQLWRSTPSEFMLGFLAAVITVTIGTIIGTTAAYYGGIIDTFFMRLADLMLLFPGIAFLIVLSGFFKLNLFWLALILGLLGGFGGITLVIKAQALTIKVKPYIEAAKVAGASNRYIIFNHIIPNVMPLSFLYMMFNVTGAVFSEASLSFFGLLRIRISWGIMINTAWTSGYLSSGNIGAYWWLWIPAGLIITIFCSGFYFLGRGLEEIVNPRLRKR